MIKSLVILDINSHSKFKKQHLMSKFVWWFHFYSQRSGRKGDEVREFCIITLLVSLVTSVLESNGGICSDCNILLCWISERLRLVNSSEESIRLLIGLNGNIEQLEQKLSYFNKQIWVAHSVTADARRKSSVNVSDGYVITWVIWQESTMAYAK